MAKGSGEERVRRGLDCGNQADLAPNCVRVPRLSRLAQCGLEQKELGAPLSTISQGAYADVLTEHASELAWVFITNPRGYLNQRQMAACEQPAGFLHPASELPAMGRQSSRLLERAAEVRRRKVNQRRQLLQAHVCIDMLTQVLSRPSHLPRRQTASRPAVTGAVLAGETKQGED